jgi:hypothetical protein
MPYCSLSDYWVPAFAGTTATYVLPIPYAASALAGFSGGVMAPEVLISPISLAE